MTWEQIELFEIWRQVIGYEGYYEVSNWGRVRSVASGQGRRTGRVLNSHQNPDGYLLVPLTKDRKRKDFGIHRLVLAAFSGPCPVGKEVDHIDGNRSNNIVLNLRYVSRSQNMAAAYQRCPDKWNNLRHQKLQATDLVEIRRLSIEGMSGKSIAERFAVTPTRISQILRK